MGWTLSCVASIHLHCNTPNFFDAFCLQMIARLHHQEHASKFLEVDSLFRFQRMLDEEWNDAFQKMLLASHAIAHPVAVILANHAASEMRLQCMEDLRITLVLHDGKFREDLKAGPHFGIRIDSNMEATLTVHEACDPLRVKFHQQHPSVKSLRVSAADADLPCGSSPCPPDCYYRCKHR